MNYIKCLLMIVSIGGMTTLAHPADCCSDELVADGSFEYPDSGAGMGAGTGGYESFWNAANYNVIGDWQVEYSAYEDGSPVGQIWFLSDGNNLFNDAPRGDICVFLGYNTTTGNLGPYTNTTLSEQIYTKLKSGSTYHFCFMQGAFTNTYNSTISGEVWVELDGHNGANAFSGDFKVPAGSAWVMQSTNITIPADDFYYLKFKSCSSTNVAVVDGASLRGPL